ncbi:MAG TPA: DUF4331 domain-containing protein, partial [Xanthomonadaceae bacterium]|nr:DUF4331 domain-containing protein [Xanthomonadaceae bacterium]
MPASFASQPRGVNALARVAGLLLLLVLPSVLFASSHREAPAISRRPAADNTDVYVFVSPNETGRVVLAASWVPFEAPEAGPLYWEWDDDIIYEILVDNDGDAVADITYRLQSQAEVENPDTFLYATGPITSLSDPDWNRKQRVTISEVVSGGATTVLVDNLLTAPANIGSKSTPDHAALVAEASRVYTDPGNSDQIFVYAGQTDDGAFADLQLFDLLTLRGQSPPVGYSAGGNRPVDSYSGHNVHSLVIEVPADRLVAGDDPVIGVWAVSRQVSDGQQVSRAATPMFNQAFLPLGLKDSFNALAASGDLATYALLQESVEDPELGSLLCALYGLPLPGDAGSSCATAYTSGVPRSGRGDVFDILLQGMVLANPFTIQTASGPLELPKDFNVNRPAGVVPAEMLRLNTSVGGASCAPEPSRLGLLGGDLCGFPNGRRPADDVVDIILLAVAGAAYEALDARDATFAFNSALLTILRDGVDDNDLPFASSFPYLAAAQSGQEHVHEDPSVFADGFESGDTSSSAHTASLGASEPACSEGVTVSSARPVKMGTGGFFCQLRDDTLDWIRTRDAPQRAFGGACIVAMIERSRNLPAD